MTASSSYFSVFMLLFLCRSISGQAVRNMSNFFQLHSVAYVTVPSQEVAKNLARGIVEKKLAACVNIIPGVTSVALHEIDRWDQFKNNLKTCGARYLDGVKYEWENKVTEDNELLMMIKTRTDTVDALTKYVKENHPYQVCEVISIPIQNGNEKYLQWISDVVPAINQRE